jgi:hypothetical protein
MLSMSSIFGITVGRLCRIRASTNADALPLPLDAEGFLDIVAVEEYSGEAVTPGALVPTTALTAVRAFVLLGEPGMGKSTEFSRLIAGPPAGVSSLGLPRLVRVDGADLSADMFEDLLGARLRALPAATGVGSDSADLVAGDDAADLTIVIDQLDDSPMVLHLAARLRVALAGRDTSRLRMIFGCRTADYPTALTRVLEESCGDCVVADLVPLTRSDAVQLAGSVDGVDGEALIGAAVDKGAGALANVPLTLGLLVRTYRDAGSLDGSPVALFERGIQWLADEPDPDRAIVNDDSTVHQRLAVAERIAARTLLSGQRTIWCGRVLGSGEQDYGADLLALGDETCVTGSFTVTSKLVEVTLATALFTGRGANRLGFAHGSFAGYLAAKYLVGRRIPRAQLERLFLVAGADGTRSVPTLLRETAAWLVTLDPQHARWLADADPESLVAHSAIVDSPAVRELIVEALLRQADEVELGDRPWARNRRQLDHPRLAAQLGEVLAQADSHMPDDWPSMARIRLAVRLARESRTAQLAEPLVELAANQRWDIHTRLLAALTAFETAPDQAVPRLTDILAGLTDVAFADAIDPDDELRGALLDMLWPGHLSAEQVLPHLRRRRNRNLFGSYQGFQRTFASRLSEEDLPAALQWAKTSSDPSGTALVEPTSDDATGPYADLPHERPVGQVDVELIETIAERALNGPDALSRVADVAAVVWPRLDRFDHPPLPAALDVLDGSGQEPPSVRELRRALARSLISLSASSTTFDRANVWKIIDEWGDAPVLFSRPTLASGLRPAGRRQLLDGSDFVWAYRATSEALDAGDSVLTEAFAQIAGYLFDLSDEESAELAYDNQDHPVWSCVSYWFEGMPIDCELARRWRQTHRRDADDTPSEVLEAQRSEFVARLEERLDDAADGDADAFWRLIWDLQIEPDTGRGSRRFDANVLAFPGIAALGADYLKRLTRAATLFVTTADDHADEWLGTMRYDKRGWAGYLALALLHRQDRLSEVPDSAWSSWIGALVWFDATASNAGDRILKTELLSAAVKYAPKRLADAAAIYVRGDLARGGLASEVELIDPAWHADITDTWATLLDEIGDALGRPLAREPADQAADTDNAESPSTTIALPPDTVTLPTEKSREHALRIWELLLAALLRADDARGTEIARNTLDTAHDDIRRPLATRAAAQLLHHDAPKYLPELLPRLYADPTLGHDVAVACAASYGRPDIVAQLDEAQLGELYEWLSGLFPRHADVVQAGFHFVSPDEQARTWRDRPLAELSERGTEAALRILVRLRDDAPDRTILTSYLLRARTNFNATAWRPPKPEELINLLADERRRLIRSDDELAALLIETVEAIEADLPAHGDLLWDRLPKTLLPQGSAAEAAWRPKLEHALSGYIAHELNIRLQRHGLAVNREVLVQPTSARTGAGHRTDILVQATTARDVVDGLTMDRFAVVIEIKGPWNDDLSTAQRQQLAETYLPEVSATAGIYLVGWWPPDQWTYTSDRRRSRVVGLQLDHLVENLATQAAEIQTELAVRTTPVVLRIPRPHRDDEGEEADANPDEATGTASMHGQRLS